MNPIFEKTILLPNITEEVFSNVKVEKKFFKCFELDDDNKTPIDYSYDMAYTEWSMINEDSVENINPVPVVCVHGLTRLGADFYPIAVKLINSGRKTVYCVDIVGRGMSGKLKEGKHYGYPQYCYDMTKFVESLNVEYVDWVGTSMGGLIAMFLSSQQSVLMNKQNENNNEENENIWYIRKLVMNDIGPFVPKEAILRLSKYAGKEIPPFKTLKEVENYYREIFAPFGDLTDEEWNYLATISSNETEDKESSEITGYKLHFDVRLSNAITGVNAADIDLFAFWNMINFDLTKIFLIRGVESDILLQDTFDKMKPSLQSFLEIENVGHAPALYSDEQIDPIISYLSQEQ
eukprot:TRINITY_DN1339_c0_g1_i1.p1 TRINITY_DN1339_c0_g1~~TRINITY_DN1339_c0_g1_i1.p1  ORF type:complete len:348 (-),score=92.67 TRINITY_DN1339_c0_g1_i1:73-1116(-)